MKKWLTKKSNLLTLLILGFVLSRQFPVLTNNVKQENKFIKSESVRAFTDQKMIDFPPSNSKVIAIFWASWCGPCKFEMSRLKRSVESGSIPKDAIFAINPFESETEIRKFLKNNEYPFTFVDSSLAKDLGVSVTPTTIFFDKGHITSMSSGISIWGIWKAELYL